MDQVIYYVYKTYDNMEENSPKLNNTDIFPPEGHQDTEITKEHETNQDSLALGEYDEYCSSEEYSYADSSVTELDLDDDDVFPETQEDVLDPRSNDERVLNICIHRWVNFINTATINEYYLSPLNFLCENAISNADYSHTLVCELQVIKMFGQGKS